jgi:1-acyl-sn-glycerol-3-phosphate acyltransferase
MTGVAARPHQTGVVAAIARLYLNAAGWRVIGDWPDHPKAVVVAAPHTSNWDFPLMLATAAHFGVKLSFMGKKSLTEGLIGPFMLALGCVPVDRSAPHGLVGEMAAAFAREDRLILAIPPEGTRGPAPVWKNGYYHIACGAGVPLVFAVMDYARKTVTIGGDLMPTGDLASDWPLIRAHYVGAQAKVPGNFVLPD